MSKRVKGMLGQEYQSRFEGIEECVVVSLRGVDGVSNNEMRGALCEKAMRLTVVKNSLAKRAFSDLGMGSMDSLLSGPCAIATGGDSIVDLVKELVAWDKKLDSFEIKGAFLDGQTLDAEATMALSKLPNRVELQGSIVSLALSPGGQLVSAMGSPASAIAGCLKTLIENKEKAEAA